ncbi:MAG: hypothetical protein ACI90U_000682 [Pseudomonadales bacterium]|jgi:hypothetical protein
MLTRGQLHFLSSMDKNILLYFLSIEKLGAYLTGFVVLSLLHYKYSFILTVT